MIIEDSEDDAQLVIRQLTRGGYDVDCEQVDSAEGVSDAMLHGPWDMVITDHNMPGFDSSSALQIVKENDPDVPVIIVSGSIGEEVAVEAMQLGANDYIMKDNLTRLVAAVTRELRETDNRRDRRRAEEALHHLAYHDPLTGLPNRTEFEFRLRYAVEHAEQYDQQHVLLYLDLDQFKIINDTCGHAAGDQMLRELGSLLRQPLEDHDSLARVGGDEFCVLLEDCSQERAMEIARALRQIVMDFHFVWGGQTFVLGVSIGLVPISPGNSRSRELMSAADLACYNAKEKGRNCIQVYNEDNAELEKRRSEMFWATQLDDALAEDRFVLYKQLIRQTSDDGAEAVHHEFLVRMLDKERKIIAPGVFIPAAERYDRMRAVDRWIIDQAFEYVARKPGSKEDVYAINLSGGSLGDDSLLEYVIRKLEEKAIEPSKICFEVTETAAISNFAVAMDFMKRIRAVGCRFALDDFGSGLSSFSYLKAMELDYLKIDGGFVRGIVDDTLDRAIVTSIHQIGHAAGIKTIAEFVETDEIREVLRDIGVDYVQGYGIGKPVPCCIDQ